MSAVMSNGSSCKSCALFSKNLLLLSSYKLTLSGVAEGKVGKVVPRVRFLATSISGETVNVIGVVGIVVGK